MKKKKKCEKSGIFPYLDHHHPFQMSNDDKHPPSEAKVKGGGNENMWYGETVGKMYQLCQSIDVAEAMCEDGGLSMANL